MNIYNYLIHSRPKIWSFQHNHFPPSSAIRSILKQSQIHADYSIQILIISRNFFLGLPSFFYLPFLTFTSLTFIIFKDLYRVGYDQIVFFLYVLSFYLCGENSPLKRNYLKTYGQQHIIRIEKELESPCI